MNSCHLPKKFLKEEAIMKYSNGWNPLSSKSQINNIKDWHNNKKKEIKVEAPVASTRNPQASQPPQEGKKSKKKNQRKPYSTRYRIPRIQKDAMIMSSRWTEP
ncbi:hypothetical protein O181_108697 [Austropuccinia psidii MF-1]|uniref:Uncharacterized protein n=1 Tax=Austropuccinia psidii MF-1 TaxID=1389203 RepID=A0A9Q3JWE1_9BASI|nr:hypothetical protein [Austropuccinia psidii MF-1]